jgi:serine/threonine protein kinase
MTTFPSNGEYVEALQNPDVCFRDPELKAGRVELTRLGMPRAISGNFASVFSVTGSSGTRYAIKCFTREVKGQDQRYKAIHDALANMGRPWQVGFDYISQGVLVKGAWQPMLRMEWVSNSHTLIPWLERNLGHPDLILDVAGQFAQCIKDLHSAGIAHGDLQHGNLLVDNNHQLRLIDYDGMFVPSISSLGSNEIGLANYQHPRRSSNDFGPYLDRFSAWLIYGSLLALSAHPWLWSTFHKDGDEKLLLGKEDFVSPFSNIHRLASNGSPELEFEKILIEALATSTSLQTIPEFDPKLIPTPHVDAPPKAGDWWKGQFPSGVDSSSASEDMTNTVRIGTGWLRTHEGPLPPIEIAGPNRASKAMALVVTVAAILGSMAAGIRFSALFGGLVLLTWAAAVSIGVWTQYRRSDAVIARSKARRELKAATHAVTQMKKRIEEENKTRDGLDRRERKALESLEKERSKLAKASTNEFEREAKDLSKKLKGWQVELANVDNAKAAEAVQQLRVLQAQHAQAFLAARRIEPGMIPGIGPTMVIRLSVYGISTAADLDSVNGTQFRKSGSTSWFTIDGIGPAKASAISSWHQRQRIAATQGAPSSLPAAHTQALDTKFANQKSQLQAAIDSASTQMQQLKSKIDTKYADLGQGIAAREAAVRLDFQKERASSDGKITQATAELHNLEHARLDAERNRDRFQNLSLKNYLQA